MDKLTSDYLYVRRVIRDNAVLLVLMILLGIPRFFVGIWLGIVTLWTISKITLWNLKEEK